VQLRAKRHTLGALGAHLQGRGRRLSLAAGWRAPKRRRLSLVLPPPRAAWPEELHAKQLFWPPTSRLQSAIGILAIMVDRPQLRWRARLPPTRTAATLSSGRLERAPFRLAQAVDWRRRPLSGGRKWTPVCVAAEKWEQIRADA